MEAIISVPSSLRDTFPSLGVYMIYVFLKWNDYDVVDTPVHTWTPLQGRVLPQLLGVLQLSAPVVSTFWNCLSCRECTSPKVTLFSLRDGCRSIKTWPSHPNSERPLQLQSSPKDPLRLSLSLHPSLISLSAHSCFLPSSSSVLIPRALHNKSVH